MSPAFRCSQLGLVILLGQGLTATAWASEPTVSAEVRALHERLLVLDSHLDTPTHFGRAGWSIADRHTMATDLTQLDLPRMAEGGLDGGFWVIYTDSGALTPEGYSRARDFALMRSMNIRQTVAANADSMELASSAADALRIATAGKRVVYQSLENSYPVGEDLGLLSTFYQLGVRMAGPVHGRNNQFADSSSELPRWHGLSPLGRRWVEEMNRLGMVIDGSHSSDKALDQLLEHSQAPIILSHTGPKAIFDHPRNLDDERIRKLAARGGVIQLNSLFLVPPNAAPDLDAVFDRVGKMERMSPAEQSALIAEAAALPSIDHSPTASFELFMQSMLHVIKVAGVDHVGMGADWDGGGGVPGMEDVTALPKVTAALLAAGYSEEDIAKIWSGNILRVLAQAEAVASELRSPSAVPVARAEDLVSVAEASGFRKTGRYEEVERLCAAYQSRWPKQLRCFEFGRTPQGRPMMAMVASADGMLTPQAARAANRPVLLFQGGIHAGEIDGKDAGFLALREMLEGKQLPEVLSKVTWLFVPVFNVDGHERFAAWNRPNQRGPEEMGWRTTAQRLNLNRDYMKAEAPEMRAMLGLLQSWDPILYVDLHVTNGAKFRHDISVEIEPLHGWDPGLRALGSAMQAAVLGQLTRKGFRPLPFYPSFDNDIDPETGFAVTVRPPRFSTDYWASRNRFAVLVETHSWKEYPRRVAATHATVLALTALAASDGGRWREAAQAADARAASSAGSEFALSWRNGTHQTMIDFEGYAFTREPSAISGAQWIRYDESTPATWRVPLKDTVEPALVVKAPGAGYLVPVEHATWMMQLLEVHGIGYQKLGSSTAGVKVQAFRADALNRTATTLEGQAMVSVQGTWKDEVRELPAGSLFVPVSQPAAQLILGLLEPKAPDSLVSWGRFANSFERKEYMEAYVAEEAARAMLAADPALQQAFAERLATDAKFSESPAARLEFFARRHPSWDEQFNLYPVLRLERPLP